VSANLGLPASTTGSISGLARDTDARDAGREIILLLPAKVNGKRIEPMVIL
jgi:hypothetical protein